MIITKKALGRRTFLRGMGATLALPLLDAMIPAATALAKTAARNYSNVHTDVSRLEELGLVERTADGAISVPFECVEILVPLAQVA